MKKVLLYSGGMDSWLIDKLWKPDVKLYVDMNTRYSLEEIMRLPKDVIIQKLDLSNWERVDAIIPLRNLYLIMVACNVTGSEDVEICIGATAGDRSLDQSVEFAAQAEKLLSYLYTPQHWVVNGKKVKVVMPYKNHTKTELLKEYLEQGYSLQTAFDESFSCYNPIDNKPCWNCKPCFRKFISFLLNGYEFDDTVKEQMLKYMEENISNCYGRGTEDNELNLALRKLGKDN